MHHHKHHHHQNDEEEQQQQQQQRPPPEHHPLLLLQQEAALVDVGGEVEPRQTCPHVHLPSHLHVTPDDLASSVPQGHCATCGSEVEPWVCLGCNAVHCSRYVNADAEAHFFASLTAEPEKGGGEGGGGGGGGGGSSEGGGAGHATDAASSRGEGEGGEGSAAGEGHGLVLSLSDLSVWCYLCGGYAKHDRLLPFLVRAEALKFSTLDKTALLAGAQTRFQTGLVVPSGMEEAEEGAADAKPTPAQCAFEHLKARSLLAKTVRVGSVAEAQARGGLRSALVFEGGAAGGKQEEDVGEEGAGKRTVVVLPVQEKVREALQSGEGLVVVRVGSGGAGEVPEGVEACLRLMLDAS